MPNYPEIRATAREVRRRIKQDQNNPYTVRKRIEGEKNSRGGSVSGNQYEERIMSNILTQPLGKKEFTRLDSGLKERKPRFVAVIPTGKLFESTEEMVNNGEEIEYMDEWYEVKGVNNWDLVMHAIMVTVE